MNDELIQYLEIVEMKLRSLMQDIQNIKERLEPKAKSSAPHVAPTFFDACRGEDDHHHSPRN